MWWRKSSTKTETPSQDLRETIARIEKEMRDLKLDWLEQYDKFRLLHMRIAKRVQREEQLRAAEATTTEGEEAATVGATPQESLLSPRAVAVNRRILLHRSRLINRGQ
jgi:hypothetical protein